MSVKRKLTDFTPDNRNANKGTVRGLAMLEDSLRKYGAGRSILVDRNGKVIAGNKTLESAADIGLQDAIVVPTDGKQLVVVQRVDVDLDTPAGRELAIADNRTGEVSLAWDAEVLQALAGEGVDLAPFFDDDELAALLADVSEPPADPGAQVDKAEELKQKYGVEVGQVWQLGQHRIACIDSTNKTAVMKFLSDVKIGVVFADPLYGIEIVSRDGSVGGGNLAPVGHYAPVIGDETIDTAVNTSRMLLDAYPKAAHIWWGANYYASNLPNSSCWLVWNKRDGQESNNFADCELAWTNQSKPARVFNHLWMGMIKASENGDKRVHPTQKPVELAYWCFEQFGEGVIFDPFAGSGITVIAGEQLGRTVYAAELSPEYVAVIIDRWEQMTGRKAERLAAMGLQPQRERA